MNKLLPIAAVLFLLMSGCNNAKKETTAPGELKISFKHSVDGKELITDNFVYTNAAGNQYMISEIQWFLSHPTLIRDDGSSLALFGDEGIHYVDTDLPETRQITATASIPAGNYRGLRFTFGLNEADNRSLRFVNPPRSFMFWPDYLGGGYHYMKLNGKWINTNGLEAPFNFHLGIGQEYDSTALKSSFVNPDDCCAGKHCEGFKPPRKMMPVKAFIQNYFEISFEEDIRIENGKTTLLELDMQVEKWFNGKHIYDHNHWGGSIMQLQPAMQQGCENGAEVFRLNVKGFTDESK